MIVAIGRRHVGANLARNRPFCSKNVLFSPTHALQTGSSLENYIPASAPNCPRPVIKMLLKSKNFTVF